MKKPAPILKIRSNPTLQRELRKKVKARLRARKLENPDWVDLAKIAVRDSVRRFPVVERAQFRWLQQHFEKGRAPGLSLVVQAARSVVGLVKKKVT